MGKETVIQVQEAQRVPFRINPKRNTPKHIVIKMTKLKIDSIKSSIGKAMHNTQENSHKIIHNKQIRDTENNYM